jgi:hypothetical protein
MEPTINYAFLWIKIYNNALYNSLKDSLFDIISVKKHNKYNKNGISCGREYPFGYPPAQLPAGAANALDSSVGY